MAQKKGKVFRHGIIGIGRGGSNTSMPDEKRDSLQISLLLINKYFSNSI